MDDNLLVGRNITASDLLKDEKAKYGRLLQQASDVGDIAKLDFGDKDEDIFALMNLTTDSQEQQSKLR